MAAPGDNEENAERLRASNELNIIQLIRHELNNRDENGADNGAVLAATLQNAQNMSAEQIQQVLQGQQHVFGASQAANSQALFDAEVEDMEVQQLSQGLGSATISEKSQSTNYSPLPVNLLSDSPFPDSGSPPPSVSPAPNGRILQDGETQDALEYFGQEQNKEDDKEINDIFGTPVASSQMSPQITQEPLSFGRMQESQFPPEIGATPSDPRQHQREMKNDNDSNGSVFSAVSVVRPTPKRRGHRASRDSRARRSSLATATSFVNDNRLYEKANFEMPSLPPMPATPPFPTQLEETIFKKQNDRSRDICDISTYEMPSSFTNKFANRSAPLRTLQVTESLSRERTLNEGREFSHMFPPPSIPKNSFRENQLNMSQQQFSQNERIKTFKSQDWKSYALREKMNGSASRFQPYKSQRGYTSQASSGKAFIPKVQNWLATNSSPSSSMLTEQMPSNFEDDLTVFDRIRSKESQKTKKQMLQKQNKAEKIFDKLDEEYKAQKKNLPQQNFSYASSIQLLDPNNFR